MNTLPMPRVKALLVATVLPVVFILLLCAQAYGQPGNSLEVSCSDVGQAGGFQEGEQFTGRSATGRRLWASSRPVVSFACPALFWRCASMEPTTI